MADPIANLRPALASLTAAPGRAAAAAPPAASFGALLERVLTDAVEAGRKGEAQATQAVAGATSLQEVVEAVNAAELTLQTVVAMRDRMVSAYQEIMRMPM